MDYILNTIYPDQPMSIIFNTAIQTGKNSPDSSTHFPCMMEVDWVRYYQKLDN
jgi:beta-glucanase (GH16 family)